MNLFLNSSSSLRNTYTVNSITAQPALDSTSAPALSTLSTAGTPDASDSSMFDFDIKSFVQQWIAASPNYGMMLRAYNEYISLDGFVFYGANADAAHRPKLTIKSRNFHKKRAGQIHEENRFLSASLRCCNSVARGQRRVGVFPVRDRRPSVFCFRPGLRHGGSRNSRIVEYLHRPL